MTWLQLFHWLSTHQLLVFLVTLFSAASHWLQALSNTTSSGEEKIPPKIKISSQSISVMANPLLLYFLPLQWALYSRVHLAATKSEQLSALDHLVAKGLQEGNDIQEDESLINLSMIMTNMAPEEAKVGVHPSCLKAFDPWSWSAFPPPSNPPCQNWNHRVAAKNPSTE